MLRWPNAVTTLPLAGLGACTAGIPISGPAMSGTARPAGGPDSRLLPPIVHATRMPDSVAGRRCWQSVSEAGAATRSPPGTVG